MAAISYAKWISCTKATKISSFFHFIEENKWDIKKNTWGTHISCHLMCVTVTNMISVSFCAPPWAKSCCRHRIVTLSIVVWPTMSCFADWLKRRHVTLSITTCSPLHSYLGGIIMSPGWRHMTFTKCKRKIYSTLFLFTFCLFLASYCNNNDRLTAFDPGQPG